MPATGFILPVAERITFFISAADVAWTSFDRSAFTVTTKALPIADLPSHWRRDRIGTRRRTDLPSPAPPCAKPTDTAKNSVKMPVALHPKEY